MAIKNLEDLKKSINRSTLLVFIAIFFASVFSLYFSHQKLIRKKVMLDKQEIFFAQNLYKSNLSEKLSIVASSMVFVDYLRSGVQTRKKIYPQFLPQISSVMNKSILGMEILDSHNDLIFSYGTQSKVYVSLNLCYLNQALDPIMGDCNFLWLIFFDKNSLLNEIKSINHGIKTCNNCLTYDLLYGEHFGSFPVRSTSGYKIKLKIDDRKDYLFYVFLFLMSSALVLFEVWSWYKLSNIINKYIASPIKSLAASLSLNKEVIKKDDIDEIKILISEIDNWKEKLKMIQANENAAKLGKIAAQLAHDVRSPLSVMDMVIGQLKNIPDKQNTLLRNAMQRISSIANDFLNQYKKPAIFEKNILPEDISSLLETIFSEKRIQYSNHNIELNLLINDNAKDVLSNVNADDFKRVLSNLVNNSYEAIVEKGYVIVKLEAFSEYLKIEIIDNGRGIPADLLPTISKGGTSVGKKEGSGLGLAHAITKIKEWNGLFNIQSVLGRGTTVIIQLPIKR